MVQRCRQQAHHRGIDPGQGRLDALAVAQPLPEGHHADHQQQPRQKDRQQAHHRPTPAIDGRAEKGRDAEQRAGHRLGAGVPGQEQRAADPAGLHHLRLQQRQHHMAAAEYQSADPVETIEQAQQAPRPEQHQPRQQHQQQ